MSKLYTRKGDDGYTGRIGKGRFPKYDPVISAIGSLDEASAALGLAKAMSQATQTNSIIESVQRDLYKIMAEMSTVSMEDARGEDFSEDRIDWLELQIDSISLHVQYPAGFILPGDSKAGATFAVARTIVRRSEREIAKLLHEKYFDNPQILRYLNRLSSLCFVLELLENQVSGNGITSLAEE